MTARVLVLAAALAALPVSAQLQTRLSPETNKAFEDYVAAAWPKVLAEAQQPRPLPWLGPGVRERVRKGDIVMNAMSGNNGHSVRDGIVHDWVAAAFIPDTTFDKVITVVQDFARHKEWYPEIIDSKLLGRDATTVQGQWLLKKKKIITVVLRAELDSALQSVSPVHAYLVSRTKPVIEVKDHGTSKQSDYPPGQGHGFLWRFNAYWNFHQADGGVYVECRVISLSRDVPSGLGWIVNPFIRSMPRESLESTLKNTREAVRGL